MILGTLLLVQASNLKMKSKSLIKAKKEVDLIYNPKLRYTFGDHFANSKGETIRWSEVGKAR